MTHDKNNKCNLKTVLLQLAGIFSNVPFEKFLSGTEAVRAMMVHAQCCFDELYRLRGDRCISAIDIASTAWYPKYLVDICRPELQDLVVPKNYGTLLDVYFPHYLGAELQADFLQRRQLEHPVETDLGNQPTLVI